MENSQKAFLQWMITMRVATEGKVKSTIADIFEKDVDQNSIMTFINSVKDGIRPYDLDIVRVYFNPWSTYCWGIVNINGDAISELATSYSATEIMAYKKVLQVLSTKTAFQSTELDLKLSLTSSKTYDLTGTKAEALIGRFINDDWLIKQAENGKIVLGPRGVLELKSYLLEEDLFKECAFCKNLITSGQMMGCSRVDRCEAKFHQRCLGLVSTCPACNAPTMVKKEE